ncbi:hypothetical protein ACIBQ1_61365 [Nonomuraea sp. NPDC050153]|uniref:hypothetical protein n=1 Tax=Nonomuraea sp. NPDC050153 TaxID=3364359 RepID=UPI0037BC2F84
MSRQSVGEALTAEADILVPAALGGILTADVVPELRCAARPPGEASARVEVIEYTVAAHHDLPADRPDAPPCDHQRHS